LKVFLERFILKGKGEHKFFLIDFKLLAALKLQIDITDDEIGEVESDLELENHEGQQVEQGEKGEKLGNGAADEFRVHC
jgi:hypothetical protein